MASVAVKGLEHEEAQPSITSTGATLQKNRRDDIRTPKEGDRRTLVFVRKKDDRAMRASVTEMTMLSSCDDVYLTQNLDVL